MARVGVAAVRAKENSPPGGTERPREMPVRKRERSTMREKICWQGASARAIPHSDIMEAAESRFALDGRSPSPTSGVIWNRLGHRDYRSSGSITMGRIRKPIALGHRSFARFTIGGPNGNGRHAEPAECPF